MLNGWEGVVTMLTQLKAHTGTAAPCRVQAMTEAQTNLAIPKNPLPIKVSSDLSISDHVISFNRQMYSVPPGIPGVLTVSIYEYIRPTIRTTLSLHPYDIN